MRTDPVAVSKLLVVITLLWLISPPSGLDGERVRAFEENPTGGAYPAGFSEASLEAGSPRPIIVIPGMFASFNLDCFFKLPVLCSGADEWGWFPVVGETVYDSLLASLRASGYKEENGLLKVFFYDWRRPVGENVSLLKEAIAGLRAETGAERVDLIGHSMGGLLARAYVQDESYAQDVAHLVTIGSPHTGAAKVYPYYEAAYFYQANWLEELVMSALLEYVRVRELQPVPVLALREFVPGMQNLLPTWDYLYQTANDSQKLEPDLVHRNNFLGDLNENAGLLYDRLGPDGVATIAGTNATTTERFYVKDYLWWWNPDANLWWAWDDGVPDWPREPSGDFYDPEDAGDGTVLVKSALLETPAVQVVVGGETPDDAVDHLKLVEEERTLLAIAGFLQLSPVLEPLPTDRTPVLMLYVYGPVAASVTDPMSRALVAPVLAQANPSAAPIPGSEYMVVPGETFQLILIPDPVEGEYRVEVAGQAAGVYTIGLLDTFDPPEQTSPDLAEEWDTSSSQIEPGAVARFVISYSPGPEGVKLLAETPLIEAPVYASADSIQGRAMPGASVEIRDAAGGEVLGSETAGEDGTYSAPLEVRLKIGQRTYPRAGGVDGIPVDVLGRHVYLPGVQRSP